MSEDDPAVHRYRFGPLERRGLIAGWRGGQVIALAAGLLVGVGLLRAWPSLAGVGAAVAVVGGAAFVAVWPLAGRTAEEWCPDVLRFAADDMARRLHGLRPGPFSGIDLMPVDVDPTGFDAGSAPPPDLSAAAGRGRVAGVLVDRRARTYTAVMAATGPGFVLGSEAEQARQVGGWAGVLASMARQGSVVHRLQWVERAVPERGDQLVADAGQRRRLSGDTAAGRSYDELLAAVPPVTSRHEVLVAVAVHGGRAARAVRTAGGGDGGACTVLLREVAALRRRLADAGVRAGPALAPHPLAAAVRRGFTSVPTPGDHDRRQPRPWPQMARPLWSSAQVDDLWHVTYWVAEWPRLDVAPDFLAPLLLMTGVRRAVSVVMEPVAPLRAARQVEQARTAGVADAELRRRGGFLATARQRREHDVLARREGELADGHGQYRFSAYVTVSAEDPEALQAACGRVEQTAGQASLELRRCFGDQLDALAATLPIGHGLR